MQGPHPLLIVHLQRNDIFSFKTKLFNNTLNSHEKEKRWRNVTTPFQTYSDLDKVLHVFNIGREKRAGFKCHDHHILSPLPIIQPQGISIFDQWSHTDYELYLTIRLLSTNMKNGYGGQNITPKNKLLNSSKIVSWSESVVFL